MSVQRVDTAQDIRQAFGLSEPVQPAASQQAPAADRPEMAKFRFLSERPSQNIKLLHPFAIGETEFTEYTLRRLSAEEAAEVGDDLKRTGEMASLYSAISGIPFLGVKCMDADDAEVMAAAAIPFMPAALRAALDLKPSRRKS